MYIPGNPRGMHEARSNLHRDGTEEIWKRKTGHEDAMRGRCHDQHLQCDRLGTIIRVFKSKLGNPSTRLLRAV